MKTVRLNENIVVEIIPEYALPVEKWYGKEFASKCVEAPDDVGQGWNYDAVTKSFSKPLPKPAPEPTPEETLGQTVASLTVENMDLKNQVQMLAQTVATMQIGGQA